MERGGRTFDVRNSEVCVGSIPEYFRKMPGVVRSLHPTHSVAALGPEARWLVDGHDGCATPCGPGSPYAKVLERDGQILFLGVGLESNTAFHTAEALAELPYFLREEAEEFTIVDDAGAVRRALFRRHRPGVARRFSDAVDTLSDRGVVRKGRVGRATALLLGGRVFLDVMNAILREAPAFLLADSARREWAARLTRPGDAAGGDAR
jgi:aminoglycoside 3-N-acetyltransferase